MEFDINDDPMTYEPRPIFGYWTRRQSLVGVAVLSSVAIISAIAWITNLPIEYAGVAAFAIGCVAGYFALSRRHGLYPEQWMPILQREKEAPMERIWTPPRMCFKDGQAKSPSRAELKKLKKARRAELETDDLLNLYMSDGENDA